MTGLIRDRYEPIAVVGAGAQGEVLRARDHQHDRDVALKVRHVGAPEHRAELLREARVLLRLTPHPGVALARDDFFVEDRYYLVMDWIQGRDLEEELRSRGGSLPLLDAIRILEPVAAALDHLHAHEPPIIHRDVKPANIVLGSNGSAVLVDFGISGDLPPMRGTPAFVAPEILAGERATAASDLYAFAVTLYRALTGSLPEPGAAPDWSGVGDPERMSRAFSRGLALDPAKRPVSAVEILSALRPPSTPHNLPAGLTSFVGRAEEMDMVRRLLSESRLVTLTGAGGIGKTRLAVECATDLLNGAPDGVWFVELAPLSDGSVIPGALASILDLPADASSSPADAVVERLRGSNAMVVLDNCEHVIDDAAAFAETLLRSCPALRILATSREPLDITGEVTLRVPSLSLPANDVGETVAASPAGALFVARARASCTGLRLDDESLGSVATIVRELDGIPLAIEMAAARAGALSLAQIAGALHDQMLSLRGSRTALPRHKTLNATLSWSYSLLDEPERALFRSMGVFAGAVDFEAVRAVAPAAADAELSLAALVSASLVIRQETEAGARYRLLQPLRRFALERAEEAGELEQARTRHFQWCHMQPVMEGVPYAGAAWLAHNSALIADIREALAWSIAEGHDPQRGLLMAADLGPLWAYRAYGAEGRAWIEQGLDAARDSLPADQLSNSHTALGALARRAGDFAEARRQHERALELNRQSGDLERIAVSLHNTALVLVDLGESALARERFEESLAIRRQLGKPERVALALDGVATIAYRAGDLDAAARYLEEAVEIVRSIGDPRLMAQPLSNLGRVKIDLRQLDEADALLAESLACRRATGDLHGAAQTLWNQALAVRARGDADAAIDLLREGIAAADETGSRYTVAQIIDEMAAVTAEFDARRALVLWGASLATADKAAAIRAMIEKESAPSRTKVGEPEARMLVQRGEAMTYEQALALAMGDDQPTSANTDSGMSKFA